MDNEYGAAQAQAAKADEAASAQKTGESYEDFLKRDREAFEAKLKGEAVQKFDDTRKLGFITMKDVEEREKAIYGKIAAEMEAMRQEHKKALEVLYRARAQGLNAGATEESAGQNDEISQFESNWINRKRRP